MSSAESLPPQFSDNPTVHVNIGREKLLPVSPEMGRPNLGTGLVGLEVSLEPVAIDDQQPKSISYDDRLIRDGILTADGKLSDSARTSFNGVGYTDEELNSMNSDTLWNLAKSETGDIAFEDSPIALPTAEEFDRTPSLNEDSTVTTTEKLVTIDNLDNFLDHLESGGIFKSHGDLAQAVLKPNGMYDLIDPETGVVKSGNVPKGRLRQRFESRIAEDPARYTY